MSLSTRRVRRVALEAPHEGLVRRGAVLLEDALRTATLGDDGGRLVLVRRLDAGVILPGGSASSVALSLERSYRSAESSAVHGGDPSAPSARAVWFADAVEAHAVLASRLALGEVPSAWFWRLAVPAWRAELPRGEALRVVLASAMATEAGAGAAVSLVAELHALGGLGGLLDALRPADGGALLAACGWVVPSSALSPGLPSPLSSSPGALPPVSRETALGGVDVVWRAMIAERARTWGAGDARTLWLAAVALVADAPARWLDPALPRRARALVEALTASPLPSVEADAVAGEGAASASVAGPNDAIGVSALSDGNAQSAEAVGEAGPAERAQRNPASAEARSATHESRESSPSPENAVAQPGNEVGRASVEAAQTVNGRAAAEGRASPDREADSPSAKASADRAGEAEREAARRAEGDAGRAVERKGREGERREDSPPGEDEAGSAPRRRRAVTDGVPRVTAGAGLLFLVPVLERLGMAALLREEPHLANADLPARVLARVARRAGVPAGDPVLELFPASPRDPGALPFAWPAVWERGIARQGAWPVRRAAGQGGRRVLFDASGRLPLAAWRGETAPDRVAALANGVEGEGGSETRSDGELLVEAWAMALRRWCRRYARMGLRAVVLRPGRVAATRTHVDLLMDHRRADLRVRRAGMDIDPGWVAWLGRVVGFHYLHGEERG